MLCVNSVSSCTGCEQLLQQGGQLLAVDRRVQAAVVVQVNRGVAEFSRQLQTVVMGRVQHAGFPMTVPLQVIHAQAMNQHQHLACGLRQALGQSGFFKR